MTNVTELNVVEMTNVAELNVVEMTNVIPSEVEGSKQLNYGKGNQIQHRRSRQDEGRR